jgi:hypothetical protein
MSAINYILNHFKSWLVFLLKAVIVQGMRDYINNMNETNYDPLDIKPIFKELICDVEKERMQETEKITKVTNGGG